MNNYHIEIRFFGSAKAEIKDLIWDINRRFHIRPQHRPVPHCSLAGSFHIDDERGDERRLINDFGNICKKQDIMQFRTVGFNTFENNRVVYIEIEPDTNMDNFRWRLSQTLQPYCILQPHDYERKFIFHVTLATKLSPQKFEQVKNYIYKKTKPRYKNVLLRVAIIKNNRILREYDFLLNKMLNRREAKSKIVLSRTFNKLKKIIG